MSKRIGLLSPIFSLPNEFGIGDFSNCAYKFIDFISSINYSIWQILPINPVDVYHSPYTTVSSYAIDDMYVSIPDLKERGLIKDFVIFSSKVKRVNYAKVRKYKEKYFQEAYESFLKIFNSKTILTNFKNDNPWVYQYATYVVLKRKNKNKKWNEWRKHTLEDNEYDNEVYYEIFKQYILVDEWNKIHQYAKSKNIDILGDLPFYVGYDSADVYYDKESFLLKEDNSPKMVAGVPPDYFSEDGQLWGNPIYDWEYLKNNGYKLINERILHASKIFDFVRLDHFRAFDTYYVIDANATSAKIGAWLEPPSYDFFDNLFKIKNDIKLIAEDLGMMRDEVFTLRDHYNIPGMQVVQFTIIEEELRHNFMSHVYKRENSIIYLSTHDNETGMQWINNLDNNTRNELINYLDTTFGHHHIMTNLFKYVVSQPAKIAILSIFDILRLGSNGRINAPGTTSKKNWSFRFKSMDLLYKNSKKLIGLAKKSDRH